MNITRRNKVLLILSCDYICIFQWFKFEFADFVVSFLVPRWFCNFLGQHYTPPWDWVFDFSSGFFIQHLFLSRHLTPIPTLTPTCTAYPPSCTTFLLSLCCLYFCSKLLMDFLLADILLEIAWYHFQGNPSISTSSNQNILDERCMRACHTISQQSCFLTVS